MDCFESTYHQSGNREAAKNIRFQPKLAINQPNDLSEQEADVMTDKVMRMEKPFFHPAPISISPVQRKCSHCEEEKENMQRKEMNAEEPAAGGNLENYVDQLGNNGHPLPGEVRNFYEPRFGYDFSHVKVHTDTLAAKTAQSINALAYTTGSNIVFNQGQYTPATDNGKRLLGHELTHVVQQGQGVSKKSVQRTIGDGHDLNAARFRGNAILEAVYDNERLLSSGKSKGPAVRILQQALLDSGMTLPVHGVDGDFGPETAEAVRTFQRASGLSGVDRDGIVGPTTMGWLDQRFATSPTPAGTSRAATTGCAAFKTIKVDFASFRGSTRNPGADLDYANTVFNQCCVKFEMGTGFSVPDVESDTVLGADTTLDVANSCVLLSAEETNIATTVAPRLGSRFKVFYVENISTGDRAMSFPPFCSGGLAASRLNFSYVSNSAMPRSLAHEFGHILLNDAGHAPGVTANLMHPTNTATAEDLDATDCATIFANA